MTLQKSWHNVKTNVEATFLKRFCAGWDAITMNIGFGVLLTHTKHFIQGQAWKNDISIYNANTTHTIWSYECYH